MSLHVNPHLEAEIQQRAISEGVTTEQLIDRLLHPYMQKPSKPPLTMLLMNSWLEEDETDDPAEIYQAEEETRNFKHNMNQPRKEAGSRLLYTEIE